MSTFKIKPPEDSNARLENLYAKTNEKIENLEASLEQDKVDYFDFTRQITNIFEQSLSRLEAIDNTIDITPVADQITELKANIDSVKQAVEDQDINPQTEINVAPPNLEQINKAIRDIPIAIQASIEKVEIMDVEELRKNFKKIIAALEKMAAVEWVSQGTTIIGGGSGSGGSFKNAAGDVVYPVVVAGGVPIIDQPLATRLDDTTTTDVVYIGKAEIGTLDSSPSWQIAKLETASGLIKTWADGNSDFDNIWEDRTTMSYS